MMLRDLLARECVAADLASTTKESVLRELASLAGPLCRGLSAERLFQALLERERLGSTGLADGLAIPHGRLEGLTQIVGAFGRVRAGIPFDALDGRPSTLFFALFAPENAGGDHLKALARVSRILRGESFRRKALEAPDAEALHRLLCEADERG